MDDMRTIVPKKCVPFDNMGTCFFYKNTEQNGPLVLKWNQLFLSSEFRAEQIGP